MTRKYEKTGLFSKKETSYHNYGSFDHIMLSIKKFEEWINKSRKGDKISYYRGYIMAPQLQKFSPTTDERRVGSLKRRVMHAYDQSFVTLVQRRHDDLDYEYIAVRI